MRKHKHPEHVNHERWLVSYADFITLLFAFFVVMFAVSQVDSKKMGRFSESFAKAVGIDVFPESGKNLITAAGESAPTPTTGGATGPDVLPDVLADIKSNLAKKQEGSEDLKGVSFVERRHELVLRLSEHVTFGSGDDHLKEPAIAALKIITEQLRGKNVQLRVEGHTDNMPISTAHFHSNWELSTARATSVIAALAKLDVLPPATLSAAGYGEFHPVASNDTADGRALNRRVDLVLSVPLASETPAPVAPKTDEAAPASSSKSP